MKTLKPLFLTGALVLRLHAQTIDDGIMLGKDNLFAGNVYTHDSWDHYWQGSLNRDNGNLGTVTTQVNTWTANYGVTDRLNAIAMVPYVWTEASQGVLRGMSGFQDLTMAMKFSLLDRPFTRMGSLRLIGVTSLAVPLRDYEADFLPLSIGNQTTRISGRLTLNFQTNPGMFFNASGAYTRRSNVTLDRPYYYTNGKLHLTDVVEMPGVFDYMVSAGYFKHGVKTEFSFSEQRTQGGGDIRRQEAPFISNQMNYSRIGAMAMVPIPKLRNFAFHFGYGHVLRGRNVGQGTTYTTAMMYTLHFHRRSPSQ